MMGEDKDKGGKMPAIMIALEKAKSKGKASEESDDEEESSEDDAVDPDELEAAKAVRSAKTDEAYANALKTFIKICGGY